MKLYIVRDERHSEVAAYTIYELAKRFADYFGAATRRQYVIETIELQ